MKVSLALKLSVADPSANETPATATTPAEDQTGATSSALDDRFALADGSDTGETVASEGEVTDPYETNVDFYSQRGPTSTSDFKHVTVPKVEEILSDPAFSLEMSDTLEFYDLLGEKYLVLRSQVEATISNLKKTAKENPGAATTLKEVIKDRLQTINEINDEIAKLEPLKEAVKASYAQEVENLKAFGQEYYIWFTAYKNKENYNGEPATLRNKPSANDPKWKDLIDKNGDNRIGDTNWYICTKEAIVKNKDNKDEAITIYDVVDEATGKALIFNADGEVVGSSTDPDYKWTISDSNLSLANITEPRPNNVYDETDVLLKLNDVAAACPGNGFFNAPINLTIKEFVWVDKDGKMCPVTMTGSGITQSVSDITDKKLVRVTNVEINNANNGSDYLIQLYGAEDSNTPIASIQIEGTGNQSATRSQLSLTTVSDISIDASKMPVGNASFELTPEVWEKIGAEYGLTNPEKNNVYTEAKKDFGNGTAGLLVYSKGGSVSMKGSRGNDLVLLSELDETNKYNMSGTDGEATAAMYTNTVVGNEGYNAVFKKNGNLFATGMGIVVGDTKPTDAEVQIMINTVKPTKDADNHVYINITGTNNVIDIGNPCYPGTGSGYGVKGDDAYIMNTTDVSFQSPLEPDAWDFGKLKGLWSNKHPGGNAAAVAETFAEGFDNLANFTEIRDATIAQFGAHEEALKEAAVAESDESAYDYTDAVAELTGEYGNNMSEMENFFTGWENEFHPDMAIE